MASSPATTLKRTALNEVHRASGARMVEFGGWEMPVEYSGIVSEHLAVRERAGLFDVSHMGEIEVQGPKALALLQHLTSNDVSRIQVFQAQYSALMKENGCAVDDCVIHRLGEDHFFICVNAANTEKDYEHILRNRSFSAQEASVENVSAAYSQLALQGPRAVKILSRVSAEDVSSLKYYWFRPASCCGVEGLLARTGYTGEDGFEFYFPPAHSEHVWNTLLAAGKEDGLVPAGLGARNTLRLEASYPLYGHELDEQTTLLESNLAWICKLEKGPFMGRETLLRQKEQGPPRKLIGLEMIDRGIAREGYGVAIGNKPVGRVTSGSYAPFLKKNIALAHVTAVLAGAGGEIQVEIRGKMVRARQTALPFYKRQKP
ncbi:MAG: glycine cleavage system aminomethyltransferase GcvT [Acidobacteriota bacterium]|nr:glycine cleavage system aminomethyltransferase GcvT [Acidobacteriota bacterium]